MTAVRRRSCRTLRHRGSSAVEYITALVLVGISCIIAFKAFGTKVKCKMAIASAKLDGSDPPAECAATQVASSDPTPGGDSCRGGSCMIPGGSCFVAGTLVLTESGAQPIETVRAGDRVLSRDEHTGAVTLQTVTRTFVTPDMPLVEVHIARDDGSDDAVTATPGHLFWTADHAWTRADRLVPGEALLDAAGAPLTVVATSSLDHDDTVYNFEVRDTHTYFVGALATWVHNPYTLGDPVILTDADGDEYEGTVSSVDPLKINVTKEFGEAADPPYEKKVFGTDKLRPAGTAAAKPPRGHGPATITHYSPPGLPGRGSEYVQPGSGPIIITSHGIGSGVYGVDGVGGYDPHSTATQITMNDPYHLSDPQHAEAYSAASKRIQELANAMKNDSGIAGNPSPSPAQIQSSMGQHPAQVQSAVDAMNHTFQHDPGFDPANT